MDKQYAIKRTNSDDELLHYGIKGMKWGVRRASAKLATSDTRRHFDSTKAEYKTAKKAYNKSFDKAYDYSSRHPISQYVSKKKSAEADRRWDDAIDKAEKLKEAKSNYKQAKRDRRASINKTYRDINDRTGLAEKLWYSEGTRKKAAKYVVDNNMSMDDAVKRANKDAQRNTAIILGVYGSIALASLYANKR